MSITIDLDHLPPWLIAKHHYQRQKLEQQGQPFITLIPSQAITLPANLTPLLTGQVVGSQGNDYLCKLAHDQRQRLWGECNCPAHIDGPYPRMCYHLTGMVWEYEQGHTAAPKLALAS